MGSPRITILSQINPIPRIDTSFFKVHSNIFSSRLGLTKGLFPVVLRVKIIPSSILVLWHAHLNVLDLITLTILGERYKLWSSSTWSLLHSSFAQIFTLRRIHYLKFSSRSLISLEISPAGTRPMDYSPCMKRTSWLTSWVTSDRLPRSRRVVKPNTF